MSVGGRRPLGLVLIAGGGTAGHILPAVAVARALQARGHDDVLFVGSRRGMEVRLVPEEGFAIVALPGRGIIRQFNPASLVANFVAVSGLVVAVIRSLGLVLRRRPAVVLCVGGYAGMPAAVAAVVMRVPLVVAEANGRAGATNRMVGRWAKASAVAFPASGLPREVLTGNPVRPEIVAISRRSEGRAEERAAARDALGLPADRQVVAVTGGSLGARRINEATLGLAARWADRDDLAIHHVVGSRDWAWVSARLPAVRPDGVYYRAVEYEARMPELLVAADIVVGRAGGTTLAELTVAGVPSVLVPLPVAPDDHQSVGARYLVDAGAAILISDGELTAQLLDDELAPLLCDPARLAAMADAAGALGRPDAAERVADLLEEHARA